MEERGVEAEPSGRDGEPADEDAVAAVVAPASELDVRRARQARVARPPVTVAEPNGPVAPAKPAELAADTTELAVEPAALAVEVGGDAFLATQLAVTLPLGPAPTDLNDQRTWAEIRRVQLETDRTVLELGAMRRRELDMAADASRAHVYTFYSGVDAESVRECMAELGQWSRRDTGSPITVIFNSPGGSVLDGLALFDYLRQLRNAGHHVTTVALGRAASMGAVLLQAGDQRVIGENAFMLVHEVSHLSVGKVSEMEDSVEFTRRLQKRLLAILASRSTLSEMQIARRWARKEWWLDASEAVELGLADSVL